MISMTSNAVILTQANLSAAFTERTTEVWCTFAEQWANTNFDGASYFCQFCGATDHVLVSAVTA